MIAYIINMDSATARWQHVSEVFAATRIPFERVSGVNGRALNFPIAEFDETRYRSRHGKHPNPSEIGCYLSHIKALRLFVESKQDFGVICEDDITPVPGLRKLLEEAVIYRDVWDILRLSGFHNSHPRCFADLVDGYSMAINFTRLCGTGAYMVSREVAMILIDRLLPMSLPIDHALDREWAYGLRSASIFPLPVDQVEHAFQSQTIASGKVKLPAWRRYWTVFPYRAGNEISRFIERGRQFRVAKAA
jgi:glycosyl transferase family 25